MKGHFRPLPHTVSMSFLYINLVFTRVHLKKESTETRVTSQSPQSIELCRYTERNCPPTYNGNMVSARGTVALQQSLDQYLPTQF